MSTGLIASYNHFPISSKDINVAFDNYYNNYNARTFDRALTRVQSVKDGTLWAIQSTSSSLNYGNIQSLRYIIKPRVLNQTLCKLNSSSNVNITSGGGIDVTGVSNEIVYINGSTTGIININTWNTISINLPTLINANAYVMGNLSYNGLINDEKICNNILTGQQIKNYHNQFASKVVLFEDFSQYPVGATRFANWITKIGSITINEFLLNDSVLTQSLKGLKYINLSSGAVSSIPITIAYGTWEFYVKGYISVGFINGKNAAPGLNNGSYSIFFYNDSKVYIQRNGTNLFVSSTNFFNSNKLYGIKITRNTSGLFNFYIKGDIFGNNYHLLYSTIDNTFTTSNYFTVYSNGIIANLKITQGIIL